MSIPIELHVTRYQCPHCTKSYSKRATTVEHIGRCWVNPEARGCKTCEHFEPGGGHCGVDPCNCPVYEESCRAGVQLPPHPRRVDMTTLAVHCPKWEPRLAHKCQQSEHNDCSGFSIGGQCYCPCHDEESAA